MKNNCPIALPFSPKLVTMLLGGAIAAAFWLAGVLRVGASKRYRTIRVKTQQKRPCVANITGHNPQTKKIFTTQRKKISLIKSLTKVKVINVSAKSLTGIETPKLSQSASALTRSTLFFRPLFFLYGGAVKATSGLAALCGGSFNRYRAITSKLKLAVEGLNLLSTQRT